MKDLQLFTKKQVDAYENKERSLPKYVEIHSNHRSNLFENPKKIVQLVLEYRR